MEDMSNYTYIQSVGNGKHLVEDTYLRGVFSNKVSLKIAEESEIGIKLNGLTLKIISTYPEYLRKRK